ESGIMVAMRGAEIVPVSLAEACADVRGVDDKIFEVARSFFG
ncbi:6-phosphofructokinase, partial [bacterium]|nr:6-phosphofructokinase [bacterium]